MIFSQIPSGGDRNFGYLVGCETTKRAAVVDPSPDPHPCSDRLKELSLNPVYLINTHSHFDHTSGNSYFLEQGGISLVTHPSTTSGQIRVESGDSLELGNLRLDFIHTAGHTFDSICVLVEGNLITGDTLFVGKIGGTSGREAARIEFDSLKKLLELPDETMIWPGHDYGVRPFSTIGEEKTDNPFCLRLNNFEDFIWLKENWESYKIEHNIS